MPYKCCAVNCKGNYYVTGPKVSIFRFPKDEEQKLAWLKFVNRKDFIISDNSRLCEQHFRADQLIQHSDRVELKPGAIPSISFNFQVPKYDSQSRQRRKVFRNVPLPNQKQLELGVVESMETSTQRRNVSKPDQQQLELGVVESMETSTQRRNVFQNISISKLNQQQFEPELVKIDSMETSEEHQKQPYFSSLSEFRALIRNDYKTFTMKGKFQIIDLDCKILFVKITCDPIPKIRKSAVITDTLVVSVFGENCEYKAVGAHTLPKIISSVDEILNVLKLFADANFETSHSKELLHFYLNSAMDSLNGVRDLFNVTDSKK